MGARRDIQDRLARGDNADALNLFIREWSSSQKMREVFHRGQGNRVPFAAVNSMKDIYEDDQLKFREYFVSADYPGVGKRGCQERLRAMVRTAGRCARSPRAWVSITTRFSAANWD